MNKKKVILVTDGDKVARKAVEMAAKKIGGRCISRSAGNPTPIDGEEIITLIKQAKYDPVVVMVDDKGHTGEGKGEQALKKVASSSEIELIGVIAVASNTEGVIGTKVDLSITKEGTTVTHSVDKYGNEKESNSLLGDTVDVLNDVNVPIIIGIGDPGKMDGKDDCELGAPIITKAMEEIIRRSNI